MSDPRIAGIAWLACHALDRMTHWFILLGHWIVNNIGLIELSPKKSCQSTVFLVSIIYTFGSYPIIIVRFDLLIRYVTGFLPVKSR